MAASVGLAVLPAVWFAGRDDPGEAFREILVVESALGMIDGLAEHHVDRPVADDLIGDVHLSRPRELRRRYPHDRLPVIRADLTIVASQ